MLNRHWLLGLAALLPSARHLVRGAASPVDVALKSSWPAPSMLLEVLETISLEYPDAFFPTLDSITNPSSPTPFHKLTPEAAHQATLQAAMSYGYFIDRMSVAMFEMNLALHVATPKIEAFYQHYEDTHKGREGTECGSWVDWYGQVVCDVETLAKLAGVETLDPSQPLPGNATSYEHPRLFAFDHVLPLPEDAVDRPPRTAILYASITSPNFRELHSYLLNLARRPVPHVEYVVRHIPPAGRHEDDAPRSFLSGYGVALDLKKTDYLAVDDRHSHQAASGSADKDADSSEQLDEEENTHDVNYLIKTYGLNPSNVDLTTPLTDDEIRDLGYNAVQLLSHSPKPLLTLTQLSQNFPKYSTALARSIRFNDSISSELTTNSYKAPGGINMLWLNGASLQDSTGGAEVNTLNPFKLLGVLQKERAVMAGLEGLGLNREQAIKLLTHRDIAVKQRDGGVLDGIFDATDRLEGEGEVVGYWNDLEKDKRYGKWSKALHGLIRPTYPGQFPTVRLNLFNIILILDLSQTSSLQILAGPVAQIIERNYPFRFGVVALGETEDAQKMARVYWHLMKRYGRKRTVEFVKNISQHGRPSLLQSDTVNWNLVREAYNGLLKVEHGEDATNQHPLYVEVEHESPDSANSNPDGTPITQNAANDAPIPLNKVLSGEGPVQVPFEKIRKYTERLGATAKENKFGHGFVNGKHLDINDDFLKNMQQEIAHQLQYLQEQFYEGKINDNHAESGKMATWFYDQPTSSPRRNKYIYPSSSATPGGGLRIFNLPELFYNTEYRSSPWSHLYPKGNKDIPIGMYIIADFDTEEGLALLKEGIEFLQNEVQTRIAFIHNPKNPESYSYTPDSDPVSEPEPVSSQLESDSEATATATATSASAQASTAANPIPDFPENYNSLLLSYLIYDNALSTTNSYVLLSALGIRPSVPASFVPEDEGETEARSAMHTKSEKYAALMAVTKGHGFGKDGLRGTWGISRYEQYVKSCRRVLRELKVFGRGELGIVVNGRVVGPIKPFDFKSEDFEALERYEMRKRADVVIGAVEEVHPDIKEVKKHDRPTFANLISGATSITASIQQPDPSELGLFDAPPRPRLRNYQLLDREYTGFTIGNNKTAIYHFGVLLDPLSETAQKWSSILTWLSALPHVFIEVYLSPARYDQMPLKRFYRFNVHPTLLFDEEGNEVPFQTTFEDLPTDPIYTLAMDVPSSWLVRPREALYDLDNIQLNKLFPEDNSVSAIFSLDYLVIEGHARETETMKPPRGVQLQLVNPNPSDASLALADTQVVANLGYLQFKAKPGVFKLEIREGRGREIYEMESVGGGGWESKTVEEVGSEVALTSFGGLTLYPRVTRRKGMEREDVLDGLEGKKKSGGGMFGGLADKFMSVFGSKQETSKDLVQTKQADINIFTVASGLLYERFVGIMILSVLRNTNSTVKFWFIENFLSPSFLEFIPHLAEAYNFQYELITYKWPSWLRAQKEKQRIIWAYKILFLDVLFPMDLKKVIFVDADQIVRADLKELVDLDLQGAPYGYTPMGDDNTDMEGFRFWKTGYWKDFLKGLPYHISALYVVDLVRFRQLAAGDLLRGQYQHLSADPNSLANLDQDLPNNLQREVPIFSLHEDWLWCETWCSKDRLHRAKTIDLCQNPLTKEPKLARARQIPEWEEYDAEIAEFSRKLAEKGLIRSRFATAGADALANAGNTNTNTNTNESAGEAENVEESVQDSEARDEDVLRDEL
ncbi:hypothetical protein AX16_008171 [Volvariella volvacea WC 439]|nr:hypothetical protein AX16_008171 [Volvariella volvacea WC 439]